MASRSTNLNTIAPKATSGYDWAEQHRSTTAGKTTVHFGDVASAAERFIEQSPMLVGCVAWIRSRRLVSALAARPVALVVNKEFALRVDGSPERSALAPLRGGVPARALTAPRPKEPNLDAVRCAGHAMKGRFGALMHHKFLVRLDKEGKPTAVWTGSFNLTAGAEGNIENGMEIHDPKVAQAFLEEFSRVWALSEPLVFKAGAPAPGSTSKAAPIVAKKRAPARKRTTTKRKPPAKLSRTKAAPKRRA